MYLIYRKHKKKHKRDESLLEMHEKKLKKKKKVLVKQYFWFYYTCINIWYSNLMRFDLRYKLLSRPASMIVKTPLSSSSISFNFRGFF